MSDYKNTDDDDEIEGDLKNKLEDEELEKINQEKIQARIQMIKEQNIKDIEKLALFLNELLENAFYRATTSFTIRESFKTIGIGCLLNEKGKIESVMINDKEIMHNHQRKSKETSKKVNEKKGHQFKRFLSFRYAISNYKK